MHSFKIVSTKEKKGVYFCVIPHQWEIDGRLYWPCHLTHSKRELLRCNASSTPEECWTEFSCVLKCSGIDNFKDALKLEKQITDCTDTDAEEVLLCQSMTRNKRVPKKTSVFLSQLTDRNDLFDTLNKEEPAYNVKLISQQIIKPPTNVPEVEVPDCADTDTEEVLLCQSMTRNKRTPKETSVFLSQVTDRNEMLDSLNKQKPVSNVKLISQQIVKPPRNVPKVNVFNNNVEDIAVTEYDTLLVHNDGSFQMNYSPEDEFTADQREVDNDIQEIKFEISNIRNEIVYMKQQIKSDYQKININLDKIYKIVSEVNVPRNAASDNQPPKENLLHAFNFPLGSCEEIHQLDNEIRNNAEFKLQLIAHLSNIGGTSREADGGKVAYKVIDYMFQSAVLVNYSWTGVSRGSKSIKKKPFQILQGILDVFFEVILLADSRHTKQKNCNIFKEGVLKYAIKRSLRKRNEGTIHNSKADCNEVPSDPNDEVSGLSDVGGSAINNIILEHAVDENDPNEADEESFH